MVSEVKALAGQWQYDVGPIGYAGQVHAGRIQTEPRNLGRGWERFDFQIQGLIHDYRHGSS
jgi:polyphosphate glucokinase